MDRLSTRVIMPSGQRSTVSTPNPSFGSGTQQGQRYEDTRDATTYNLEFINIQLDPGLFIMTIHGDNTSGISSVTVNGEAATIHTSVNNATTESRTAGIASYFVTNSITANVSVTFNDQAVRCALTWYLLNNSTQYRFVSANTVESTNPSSHTLSLDNLPNDSTIIVAVTHSNAGENITFTGVTGYHEQIGGEGTEYGYAYKKNHDEGNITVTSTYPSASNKAVMAIAAFV